MKNRNVWPGMSKNTPLLSVKPLNGSYTLLFLQPSSNNLLCDKVFSLHLTAHKNYNYVNSFKNISLINLYTASGSFHISRKSNTFQPH